MQIRNYDVYRMFDGFYEQEKHMQNNKQNYEWIQIRKHMTDIRTEDTSTYLLELVQKQRHRQNTYVCTETESRI